MVVPTLGVSLRITAEENEIVQSLKAQGIAPKEIFKTGLSALRDRIKINISDEEKEKDLILDE